MSLLDYLEKENETLSRDLWNIVLSYVYAGQLIYGLELQLQNMISLESIYWNNSVFFRMLENDLLREYKDDATFPVVIRLDVCPISFGQHKNRNQDTFLSEEPQRLNPTFDWMRNKRFFLKVCPFIPKTWFPISFNMKRVNVENQHDWTCDATYTGWLHTCGFLNPLSALGSYCLLTYPSPTKQYRYIHFGDVIHLSNS